MALYDHGHFVCLQEPPTGHHVHFSAMIIESRFKTAVADKLPA